jgi:hypothetical protein
MTQTPPSQDQPSPAGSNLASLECACPICGKVVLTISGQILTYSNDHVIHSGQSAEGTTTLILSHDGNQTAVHPGEANLPPWAIVHNLYIQQ